MTVATELAKTGQRIEYILAVEGIGWPTNDLSGSISGGFDGDVFVTNDFDGTLATDLGCTIHETLNLPGSITASVGPKTAEYKYGGLKAIVQDDDWWLENYTPRKAGNTTTLSSAIEYGDTTIRLADGTNFAASATVWIGGRELVKLGTKALVGGVVYDYTGSTRGYLGTPRGSTQRRPEDNIWNLWASGTTVYSVARFWFNRRAALYAHVPGEAVDNCVLLWVGKLRGIRDEKALSVNYHLEFTGDFVGETSKKIRPATWEVAEDIDPQKTTYIPHGSFVTQEVPLSAESNWRILRFATNWSRVLDLDNHGVDNGSYALAAAYQYRTEAGGLDGMVTNWDAGTVQARNDGSDTDIIGTHVAIDDSIYLLWKKDSTTSTTSQHRVLASWADVYEEKAGSRTHTKDSSESLTKRQARFLLSHWSPQKAYARFAVNDVVTKHPVDIFLIFATSFDREFWRGDTTGGTATTPTFAAGTVGATNLWAGKALFCVEGNNKGEARVITSNTADDITVERAFTYDPGTDEYQVRNSIYDVLPVGWGMGIDSSRIDIDAFEVMRERYFPEEEIDWFIMGADGEVDIFKFLRENILSPYGISLYLDTSSGKWKPNYLGQAFDDGVVEDYVSLSDSDIVEFGDLNHTFTNPIGHVKLGIRRSLYTGADSGSFGSTETIYLRSSEVESAFSDEETETLSFKALFDTERTISPLLVRLYGLAAQYSIPPPMWTATIDLAKYLDLYPGAFVSITLDNVTNSYTGARNWSHVVGRVLKLSLKLDDQPVCFAGIEIFFGTVSGAKIAPAATVTAKGSDGNGEYFTVNTSDWTNDNSTKDSYAFVTGDLIELRDKNGALKEAETIQGFGTAYTTGDASDTDGTRIYVTGAIASAIAAGDYVTFQPWSASNTARMETYAAYATAGGALTGGDTAKEYG